MGAKIHKDEIASIIKERIDNFEINPDIEIKENTIRNDIKVDYDKYINTVIENIKSGKDMFFICPKCKNVGNASYLKNNEESDIYKVLESNKLHCECCSSDNYFVQDKPIEDEMLLASYSRWNFITKVDHVIPELIIEDDKAPHGYKLGTINSLDDIDFDKLSTGGISDLKGHLDSLLEKLNMKSNKIPNKVARMLDKPNKTSLIMELAEYKRRYKQSKKDNNKENIEYYKILMEETKNKIDITQD